MLTPRKIQSRGFRQPEREPREYRTPTVSAAFRLPGQVEGAAAPVPKTEAGRNPHLLAMASGRVCLMCQIAGIYTCTFNSAVAAHSNFREHGKGGARKADDQYTVWLGDVHHRWLDQGPAPKAEKRAAFMLAHLQQVLEWRAVVASTSEPLRFRRAAQWALERLSATPVGSLEP
ncbi:MAG: hypothetical protein V4757_07220 [Pseudomonadota bacterium]